MKSAIGGWLGNMEGLDVEWIVCALVVILEFGAGHCSLSFSYFIFNKLYRFAVIIRVYYQMSVNILQSVHS